ncbi:hypothetical protein SCMC78_29600 [Streptomyces sp. CMC78]|uniref:Uncharacterized protein n=1 Tax=Streptomyces sp. CMC78 TaxID=3231512 RepID=A0AB33KHQ6_9ACTN|nr:hypothetical protein GCM10010504_42300 [Streptomyces griseus]
MSGNPESAGVFAAGGIPFLVSQRFPEPGFSFAETGGPAAWAVSTAGRPVTVTAAARPKAAAKRAANRHLDGIRSEWFKASSSLSCGALRGRGRHARPP